MCHCLLCPQLLVSATSAQGQRGAAVTREECPIVHTLQLTCTAIVPSVRSLGVP